MDALSIHINPELHKVCPLHLRALEIYVIYSLQEVVSPDRKALALWFRYVCMYLCVPH